jgi:hypothetical protein
VVDVMMFDDAVVTAVTSVVVVSVVAVEVLAM